MKLHPPPHKAHQPPRHQAESGGLDYKSVVEFINEEAGPVRGQWPSAEAIVDNQGEDTLMDDTSLKFPFSPCCPCVCPPPPPTNLCRPASFPFHLNPSAPFKNEICHSSLNPLSKANRPCWDKNGQSPAAMRERRLKYQQSTIRASEAISEIAVLN